MENLIISSDLSVDSLSVECVCSRLSDNDRIQKFDSNGNFITSFITKWESDGSGVGKISVPSDVSIGSQENVYVTDMDNHRILVFGPTNDV